MADDRLDTSSIDFETLRAAARVVKARRVDLGQPPAPDKSGSWPRDAEKAATLVTIQQERRRRWPARMEDGLLILPYFLCGPRDLP
ncbi:MAG: hypothetical protein HQL37_08005 [Alphaproteobacteria bacterium]|nr:hypothetical protein [Alphaproteobacteria bacterium]